MEKLIPTPDKKIYKTLAVTYTPLANNDGGTVTIDIGKYYDNNAVRVAKVWMYAQMRDISAGGDFHEGDGYVFMNNTTVMQLPAASITATSGTAVSSGSPTFGATRNGEFNFLGDAILESPSFDLEIVGRDRGVGLKPVDYQWLFYLVIQLEFNYNNLNQQNELS